MRILRRPKLRPLSEAVAYSRCHGDRTADIRPIKLEPRRPRYPILALGDRLRRDFEARQRPVGSRLSDTKPARDRRSTA